MKMSTGYTYENVNRLYILKCQQVIHIKMSTGYTYVKMSTGYTYENVNRLYI